MSMHNWQLMKQRRDERIIEINQDDIHTMYDWYDHYEKINPLAKTMYTDTLERLEKGPIIKKRCEIWIMVKNLNDIAMWYKYYPNPKDSDKEVYMIIEQALNPKEVKK